MNKMPSISQCVTFIMNWLSRGQSTHWRTRNDVLCKQDPGATPVQGNSWSQPLTEIYKEIDSNLLKTETDGVACEP